MGKPKIDPYLDHLINEKGNKCRRVHVLYVDGDPKLCDGCDKEKPNLASIQMVCGDVACICEDCVKDILTIWK